MRGSLCWGRMGLSIVCSFRVVLFRSPCICFIPNLRSILACSIVMCHLWYCPFIACLKNLILVFLEASAHLGASTKQTFMRVILPLSASGIKTGFFLVFVPAFGEFVIPAILGGGKQLYVGSLISHYFLARMFPRDQRLPG